MKENIFLSIIIPIYNAQAYLEECLRAVTEIKRKDMEILLIDDGSTDNSFEYSKSFLKNDDRIRIFHKENGGPSSARNYGIRKAGGKWITFIDADDRIVPSVYAQAAKWLTSETELLFIGVKDIYTENDRKNILYKETEAYKYSDEELRLIEEGLIDIDHKKFRLLKKTMINFSGPVAKFYLRSVIEKNQIFFPEDIAIGEDRIFNYRYCKCISAAYYLPVYGYYYYQNNSSLMHAFKEGKGRMLLKYTELFRQTADKEMEDSLLQLGIRQYLYALKIDFCHPDNEKSYLRRREEAFELKKESCFAEAFSRGSIWKQRLPAAVLGVFAKYNMFCLCNLFLKIKAKLKLDFK